MDSGQPAFAGKRTVLWLLVAACVLGFALRVQGLTFQSLWRDEIDALRFAGEPLTRLLSGFATPGHNGPLYYLLLHPWLSLGGDSEFSLRFLSVCFGVLVVPLAYRVSSRLFTGRRLIACVAALLAATSPYLIWYSQEGKMYAIVASMTLLSIDRLLAATKRGGRLRWLAYVLVTGAGFYMHVVAALIVPAEMLLFTVLGGWKERASRNGFLVAIGVLVVPYLPLLAWQLPMLARAEQTGYAFVPLPEMVGSLLWSYSQGVAASGSLWMVSLVLGLLVVGLLFPEKQMRAPGVGVLGWLLLPTFLFYLITLLRPIYAARYLIFISPALLLLLAAGVAGVARRSRPLAGVLLGGLLAVQLYGAWLQAHTLLKTDFRAATGYVAQRLHAGDLLLFEIPHGRYSFEYYYSRQAPQPLAPAAAGPYQVFLPQVDGGIGPYRWAEGPYTNRGMDDAELDRQMEMIVAGSRVVWLVASEAEMWDERGRVQDWLDAHGVLDDEAQFTRVGVYRYDLPP